MKTSPVALKVAPHIHSRLKKEAETRGISINALIGWLLGDWVSNLERIENSAKQQIKSMEKMMVNQIDEGLLAGMKEALNQTDIEEEIAKRSARKPK